MVKSRIYFNLISFLKIYVTWSIIPYKEEQPIFIFVATRNTIFNGVMNEKGHFFNNFRPSALGYKVGPLGHESL